LGLHSPHGLFQPFAFGEYQGTQLVLPRTRLGQLAVVQQSRSSWFDQCNATPAASGPSTASRGDLASISPVTSRTRQYVRGVAVRRGGTFPASMMAIPSAPGSWDVQSDGFGARELNWLPCPAEGFTKHSREGFWDVILPPVQGQSDRNVDRGGVWGARDPTCHTIGTGPLGLTASPPKIPRGVSDDIGPVC